MIISRNIPVYLLSLCAFVITQPAFGQTLLAPETEHKIQTLTTLQTLSLLMIKPSVISSATTTFNFKKGTCAQSRGLLDDGYVLQMINDVMTLPANYVPGKLVDIRTQIPTAGNEAVCVTEGTAKSLALMYKDMKKEGLTLLVVSGYRSYAGQKQLYSTSAKTMNIGSFDRVAPAGQSEHQLGTAIDIANSTKSGVDFGTTKESVWIRANAHKYGFIISYDIGDEEKTGYMYEPWHLRYVGVSNAVLLQKAEYTLAYKIEYYRGNVINPLLGKLKDYVNSSK